VCCLKSARNAVVGEKRPPPTRGVGIVLSSTSPTAGTSLPTSSAAVTSARKHQIACSILEETLITLLWPRCGPTRSPADGNFDPPWAQRSHRIMGTPSSPTVLTHSERQAVRKS